MQKHAISQLEMFTADDQDITYPANGTQRDPIHLTKVRGYQKLILQAIIFMLVCLASFSLGVEKGKKLVVKIRPAIEETPSREAAQDSSSFEQNIAPVIDPAPTDAKGLALGNQSPAPNQDRSADAKKQKETAAYTIQVASISQEKNAKKELASLKNKGYNAFSLVKGKYTVICVGRFDLKEDAKKSAQKLKSKYPDYQLRRL